MGSGCGMDPGLATASIKGGNGAVNTDTSGGKVIRTPKSSAASFVQKEIANRDPKNPLGFSIAPPPDAPDATDGALKQRRAAQALMLLSGRGRRSAFLGQGYGPSALPAVGAGQG